MSASDAAERAATDAPVAPGANDIQHARSSVNRNAAAAHCACQAGKLGRCFPLSAQEHQKRRSLRWISRLQQRLGWRVCERSATPHQPTRGTARGRDSHRKRLLSALLRQVLAVQQELNHLRRHWSQRGPALRHTDTGAARATPPACCVSSRRQLRPQKACARRVGAATTRLGPAWHGQLLGRVVHSATSAPGPGVALSRRPRRLAARRSGAAFVAQPTWLGAVTIAAQQRALLGRPNGAGAVRV